MPSWKVVVGVTLILAFIGFCLFLYFTRDDEKPSSPSPTPVTTSSVPNAAPGSWKKLGDGACRTSKNEYSKIMYSHNPPYFVSKLSDCKTACESNTSLSVTTGICTGISFFKLNQTDSDPIGQCAQVARSPWVSPNVNIGKEECWYYGMDKPNGTAQYIITPDRK